MCVIESLCVWVAVGIIFSIFETASDCLESRLLSILSQRPHVNRRESMRPEVGSGKD